MHLIFFIPTNLSTTFYCHYTLVCERIRGYFTFAFRLCMQYMCACMVHVMFLYPSAGIFNIQYVRTICMSALSSLALIFSIYLYFSLPALISPPSVAHQPETGPITGCVLWMGSG